MPAQALTPLSGYENIFGTKKAFVGELNGPTLYAAGGQLVTAAQLGWGGIDFAAVGGNSLSGTYYGRVQMLPLDAAPSVPLGSAATFRVLWFVVATNAEAGALDLSGEILRLFVLGV